MIYQTCIRCTLREENHSLVWNEFYTEMHYAYQHHTENSTMKNKLLVLVAIITLYLWQKPATQAMVHLALPEALRNTLAGPVVGFADDEQPGESLSSREWLSLQLQHTRRAVSES
ncbi:MAG: hypothetical protein ACI9CE_001129 [Flavobacterium sp.]